MMKIEDAGITILTSEDLVEIELFDGKSREIIARVELKPEQFTQALSRLSNTPCEITVGILDRIGKNMEHKKLEFPMPDNTWKNRDEIAIKESKKYTPDGWVADKYFGSKDSFFSKDGEEWARCIIRRWV